MQRISRTRPHSGRSDGSRRRKRQPKTCRSRRSLASVGIASLAPAFVQALPALDTIPTAYSHELRGELLYNLCATLVREGLAGPEMWRKCEGSAVVFAQHAIMEAIGEERWNLLQRTVEYHLSVSDVDEGDGEDVPLGKGRLIATIECGSAGYLKIGPAIAALEEEAAGLGAAFYWTLTYALYRVMRIYNHEDALQYEERMKEHAEDEESRGQYEFPEVEKALPDCIQKTLIRDDFRGFMRGNRRLLAEHWEGKYGSWIERLRRIDCLSRVPLPTDACFREDGGYDTIPLPSVVIAFNDHDAIVACFDEESQYMLEGSAEPTVGAVFSPSKPEEFRRALRMVSRFVALNVDLFQLVEDISDWEKGHGGTRLYRGEPSLRAA